MYRIAFRSVNLNKKTFQDQISSYNFEDGQNNRFKTIVAFDCRGLEPIDFSPRNGWTVKGYKVLIDSQIAVV